MNTPEQMPAALRDEVGEDWDHRIWGLRVSGDMHGVTLQMQDGTTRWYSGPFHAVRAYVGDDTYAAIRRFG